jgi:hypothetical protein
MAIFYVLPPRPVVGSLLVRILQGILPGLRIPAEGCLELLQNTIETTQEEIYLVHREDLSDEDVNQALIDGFGAEIGDQIIHVSIGSLPDQPKVRTWQIEDADSAVRVPAFV